MKILVNLKKQKMFIKDAVIIKIMNNLEITFVTYIIILNENIWNNKNMSKIDNFFKKLEDEKYWMKQSNTSMINTVNQIQDCEDCEDYEDYNDCDDERDKSIISESSTSYCTSCDDSHSSNIECLHKYWDCHVCNKKSHESKNCDYVIKATKEKTAKKNKNKIKVLKSNNNDDSDDDKKNITMITRWIDLINKKSRMFNNIILNMLMIKLIVNHVNKDILMSMNLLIDLEVTAHIIVNWRIFTQFSTKIFYY